MFTSINTQQNKDSFEKLIADSVTDLDLWDYFKDSVIFVFSEQWALYVSF
jgi:hypothetical protein